MKVANSLHQNQRSLNILSFEKALGYHLDRQAHRHQSNRQSAGHHPRYAQKSVGTYHPVSFRQSHLHLFLRVERPTYYRQISLLLPRFFQDEIEVKYKQIPQFIGYQQMLLPRLLIITHRN